LPDRQDTLHEGHDVTLAEIHRMIRAAIRAAKQEGAREVEVKIGEQSSVIVKLSTAPKSPVEADEEIVL
jgi:pyruvate/2-oxoglutarate/acetoin dehydrogenase E1 component